MNASNELLTDYYSKLPSNHNQGGETDTRYCLIIANCTPDAADQLVRDEVV